MEEVSEPPAARCSFCGKSRSQVREMVAGRAGAYICNECVARFSQGSAAPGPPQPQGMPAELESSAAESSESGTFDRFTERARKVLALAQEEAHRFNHNYIGTEHLLLGLALEGEGVAARALSNLGVELPKIRSAVEFIIGRGERQVMGEIGMTPRAKRALELAVDEAHRLGHHYIGTEHLLLGLIREGEGIAAGVLESLEVTLEKARFEVIRLLSGSGEPPGRTQSGAAPAPAAPRPSMSGSFDRFTEAARTVLTLAQEEAQSFNHNYIGTEHLLLGLLREEEGGAAKVLNNMGLKLTNVRSELELIIGRGERQVVGEIGLTPRAKKSIQLGIDEARQLGHDHIGTEHLLLGLIREGEGIAAGMLERRRIRLQDVREAIITVPTEEHGSPEEE